MALINTNVSKIGHTSPPNPPKRGMKGDEFFLDLKSVWLGFKQKEERILAAFRKNCGLFFLNKRSEYASYCYRYRLE